MILYIVISSKNFPPICFLSKQKGIIMDLIAGQIYTTNDMIKFFNVSKDTWKKKKEKLLLHFDNFYEYEVEYDSKDRRKINYKIIKQLGKYEPPQKKSVIRNKTYENEIVKVIEVDNIQTAKNVSRIIKDTDEIKAFNHTEGTVYEYTRVRMRNMFGIKAGEAGTHGKIVEKIWCRLRTDINLYIDIPQEEIQDFYKFFNKEKNSIKEAELTLYSDFENGLITRDELNEQIGETGLICFLTAKEKFREKYGYYPIKVPVYELSAYEATEETNEMEKIAA